MAMKFDIVEVVSRFKMVGVMLGVSGSILTAGIVLGVLMASYEELRRELHEQKEDTQRELDFVRSQMASQSTRMNSHQVDMGVIKKIIRLEDK